MSTDTIESVMAEVKNQGQTMYDLELQFKLVDDYLTSLQRGDEDMTAEKRDIIIKETTMWRKALLLIILDIKTALKLDLERIGREYSEALEREQQSRESHAADDEVCA